MIRILDIISNDEAASGYLKHISPNLLENLKKDKALKKIYRLSVQFNTSKEVEDLLIRDIRGNQEKICSLTVDAHPSVLAPGPGLGVLTCRVLEKLYQLNDWDSSFLTSVKQLFAEGNYQVRQSLFKKTMHKDLKLEILVSPEEQFAKYSFRVTDKKKGTSEISFFKGILDPLRMKYLFNQVEAVGNTLVISDLRKQITTTLDPEKPEAVVSFNPKEHDLEFLKKFRHSFEYDSGIENPGDLWVKYVNS